MQMVLKSNQSKMTRKEKKMITAIIEGITSWATGLVGITVSVVNAVVALFWNGTALTFPGILALMAIAMGFVMLGIGFVRGLISK